VNLLVNQLKLAIRELLDRKGVRARVVDKMNRRDEIVIGVILEGPEVGPGLSREERKERQQR
jgi:hypothetical protein